MKNAEASRNLTSAFRNRRTIGRSRVACAGRTLRPKTPSPLPASTDLAELPAIKPGTNTSFASLKQIDAGLLNVGYAEDGPPMVPPSFFCMAGPTTSTATSMLRRCWPRRAIG